ncbi:hypothetical protein M885DRAFT_618633 [Pelagophyceae sp. CCMP2097]|nr:hypothetical protein M885DRAFT_618633 [Pelagophyceae sp. CCMP2097]
MRSLLVAGCFAAASGLVSTRPALVTTPRHRRQPLRAVDDASAPSKKKSRGDASNADGGDGSGAEAASAVAAESAAASGAAESEYYGETALLWAPVLDVVDVRCALVSGEILGVTTVTKATRQLREGNLEVRKRYRAKWADVMLPRYRAAAQQRSNLEKRGQWSNAVSENARRVQAATALSQNAFVQLFQKVLNVDAQAAPTGDLLRAGDDEIKWFSFHMLNQLEAEISGIAKAAARKALAADLKEQGSDVPDDAALDAALQKKKARTTAAGAAAAVGTAALIYAVATMDHSNPTTLDSLLDVGR